MTFRALSLNQFELFHVLSFASNIQIQPGLKARLWLIIIINKKIIIINRVKLNGDGNENGIKINRSNQQKNKFALNCSMLFCLSLVLFCTTTMPFCTPKTSNFLVTHCFLCPCSLLFFPCRSFLPGHQHFSSSHRRCEIFFFFFKRNSSSLFSVTGLNSFCVIHVSVNIKNNVEKDTTLFFFSLQKSGRPYDFLPLHLGCHTC